jgi:hypothetical protein
MATEISQGGKTNRRRSEPGHGPSLSERRTKPIQIQLSKIQFIDRMLSGKISAWQQRRGPTIPKMNPIGQAPCGTEPGQAPEELDRRTCKHRFQAARTQRVEK